MTQLPFTPVLPPLDYQSSYLDNQGLAPAHGLIWAPGTGKTKGLIDNASLLLVNQHINGILVLAPNGVHRNWVTEELPKHWPNDSAVPRYEPFEWNTSKASTKKAQAAFASFLQWTQPADKEAPLAPNQPVGVLCMSYDGLMTDMGKQASWDFLRKRRCLYIADESQRFKEPGSKRNIRVYASSAYAPYRRIASGTPMDKPFDIYPQMRFLDEDFWKRTLGIGSFAAFKTHFGNWHPITLNTGVSVNVLDERRPYRNLDQLEAVLGTLTSRVTEEVAEAALPPKAYHRIRHALSPAQRTAYDELADECMTTLADGTLVTAEHVLTMRLRFAQIGAGHISPAAGEEAIPFEQNPRREALSELLFTFGTGEATLQWCLWKADAQAMLEASARAGRTAIVYDSNNPEDTLDAWRAGRYHDLIGNLQSGLTEGHTLVRARKCLYYSNTPRLITRRQSEKRVHRIGQTRDVDYYDFLAEQTLDEANLEMVRSKAHWTGVALGDNPQIVAEWLKAVLRGGEWSEPGDDNTTLNAQGNLDFDINDFEAAWASMEGN